MPKYEVRFSVPAEVIVTVEADDEDEAADMAWEAADEYAKTVYGDQRRVRASMDLDGIGADTVRESS
jgi:hypothetical protein